MGFWAAPAFLSSLGVVGLTTRAAAEYDAAARAPFWLLEIDVPRCSLTYGTAPCTAAVLADGSRCCYSPVTCQDTANLTLATTTLRFIANGVSPQRAPLIYQAYSQLWPLLDKVSPVSQEIDTTGGFRLQERMTFHLHDLGSDDLVLGRAYSDVPVLDIDKTSARRNSSKAGQFWRRFVAIFPNYRNFAVRLRRGFATTTFTQYDLETRWSGKLDNIGFEQGGVTLRATDPYGGEQAGLERQAPRPSVGTRRVTTTASRSATSLTVADGTAFTNPSSVAYNVYLRHVGSEGNEELMRLTAVSGNTLTVTRAKFGTLAEPIIDGDDLDEALVYAQADGQGGVHPAEVWIDLLRRAGVAEASLDSAQIRLEGQAINGMRIRRVLVDPAPIKSLLAELSDLTMASGFVDDALRMRWSIPQPVAPGSGYGQQSGLDTITDTPHVLQSAGMNVYANENERLTHCVIYYGPTGDTGGDEWANITESINLETFDSAFYGETDSDRKEKRIETAWLWADDSPDVYIAASVSNGQAACVASRWTARRGRAPVVFEFATELRNRRWRVGSTVEIETEDWQTPIGGVKTQRARVIKYVDDGSGIVRLTLHANNFDTLLTGQLTERRYAFIAPNGVASTYGAATTADKQYWYLGDTDNDVDTGATPGYWLA